MVLQLEYQVHVGERREFVLPLEGLESGRVKGWLHGEMWESEGEEQRGNFTRKGVIITTVLSYSCMIIILYLCLSISYHFIKGHFIPYYIEFDYVNRFAE